MEMAFGFGEMNLNGQVGDALPVLFELNIAYVHNMMISQRACKGVCCFVPRYTTGRRWWRWWSLEVDSIINGKMQPGRHYSNDSIFHKWIYSAVVVLLLL